MRDYAELILDLRRHHCDAKEDDTQEVCEECAYDVIVADKSKFNGITDVCTCGLMHKAADAIEELLARDVVPTDFHERCLQLEIRKRIELEKQMPHWISVEERLPERDEKVHICFMFANKPHIEVGELWSDGKFYAEGDEYCLPMYLKERKATHWMPLPEPPKEVQS